MFTKVLQDGQTTGAGNHQIDHRANWRVLTLGDRSLTGLSKLRLEACFFEMVGNNPLDGIICLDQQNPVITLRNTHCTNCSPAWLMVNRKKTITALFYYFNNYFRIIAIFPTNYRLFGKEFRAEVFRSDRT
jgi:hypothetical protein